MARPTKRRFRKLSGEARREAYAGPSSNAGVGWSRSGADPVAEERGKRRTEREDGDPQELDFEDDA